jgi:hypothetical protein
MTLVVALLQSVKSRESNKPSMNSPSETKNKGIHSTKARLEESFKKKRGRKGYTWPAYQKYRQRDFL